MLCIVHHNHHHLFCVLLHLHWRNLWAFSFCVWLCNWKGWGKPQWTKSTRIWTQTITDQRANEQSDRDSRKNLRVSFHGTGFKWFQLILINSFWSGFSIWLPKSIVDQFFGFYLLTLYLCRWACSTLKL